MKNKSKRSRNPDPPGHLGKGIRHLLRLSGFAFILILLLALIHLLTIGIPSPITRHITSELQKAGIPLHIDSIRLSPHRGWVLHNVRIYSTAPDDLKPFFQTKKLYLNVWPSQWTDLSHADWRVTLYSKSIAVSLGTPWEKGLDRANPFRTINRLRVHLHAGSNELKLHNSEIDWGGYILRASGEVAFPDKKEAAPALYSAIQTRSIQVANKLANLTFSKPPEITVYFNLPGDTLEQATVNATFIATGFQRKGRLYDHMIGAMHLSNGQAELDYMRIAQQDNSHLTLSGLYTLSDGTTQLSLENTLPSADLIGLLPENAAAGISRFGLQPFGTADFDVKLGPCPPQQLLEKIHLQARNLQIIHNGLTFDPLRLNLTRDKNQLTVTNIAAQVNGGELTGQFKMNLDSGEWQASAEGNVPTEPIGNLVSSGSKGWVDRISFTNELPYITVNLSQGTESNSFRMRSTVSGRDLTCAGIPLDTIDMDMAYSNRTFNLSPLRATRGEREFTGDIRIDLNRKLAFFDAESGFAPVDIARIIAPDSPTVLTNFTFTGPLNAIASGQIDYSGGTNHAAQGSLRTESVSARGLTASNFQSQIEARGKDLIFNECSMNLFDGTANGSAVFDLQFNDGKSPYSLNLRAAEIDINQIADYVSTNDHTKTQGQLSGTLNLTADASAGFWASADGNGEVKIKSNQLHDFPVLGGFSRLIRTTLPGFSLFSITTLYSKFDLHEGALRTDKLELGGTLLSARAKGSFSPDKGFDFLVQAEPFRQTRENKEWYQLHLWSADLVKQGTAPFFRLLEFKLTGPLNNPQWRLANLPGQDQAPAQKSVAPSKQTQPSQ